MMRQLDYQIQVLEALSIWLDYLSEEKTKAEEAQRNSEIKIPNFTEEAWNRLKQEMRLPVINSTRDFSPRQDAIGNPVPNATLKIPTGGGKTYLAAHGVSQILSRYLHKRKGFVLWVVPNDAIYTQTLRNLKNREHHYRKVLDQASGNCTKIMIRTDRLHRRDIDGHLCVMVLMLQASNRQNKDSIRMFRDRGDVHGFLAPESDHIAHSKLHKRIPNLDTYGGDMFTLVKESLGNMLRIIRPVVVLDEGHRAMSDLAHKTLYGFNPSCVLELTATPKDRANRKSNLLVEVTGQELDREGMIKMPLILEPHQDTDWHATLAAAVERLNKLAKLARVFQADSNRYIRPIMLVQVERTGAEQRDGQHIHASDVYERLLAGGLDEAEVAIKTANQNDLKNPENLDLLSHASRVRVIITKKALQEGWDCPFAYVLCSLAASSSKSDMTQLVGRILRQPDAMKTGVAELDQCYVVSHHRESDDVFKIIKEGLEKEGLGDVPINLQGDGEGPPEPPIINVSFRREQFAKTRIFLPEVKYQENGALRKLDYQTDILAALDWKEFDPSEITNAVPKNTPIAESQIVQVGLTDKDIESKALGFVDGEIAFDPVYVTQAISHIVLNPFIGREIVGKLEKQLEARGINKKMRGQLNQHILEVLIKGLEKSRDKKAEKLFRQNVSKSIIQFRLKADAGNYEIPHWIQDKTEHNATQLKKGTGTPLERSLFTPIFLSTLNDSEVKIARYLDNWKAIDWWHRNVARKQYGVQGWQRHKVYPDFVFAAVEREGETKIVVLETKGEQLAGNEDTEYKRCLLNHLTENFQWDDTSPTGELELVENDGTVIVCKLVLIDEYETELPKIVGTSF